MLLAVELPEVRLFGQEIDKPRIRTANRRVPFKPQVRLVFLYEINVHGQNQYMSQLMFQSLKWDPFRAQDFIKDIFAVDSELASSHSVYYSPQLLKIVVQSEEKNFLTFINQLAEKANYYVQLFNYRLQSFSMAGYPEDANNLFIAMHKLLDFHSLIQTCNQITAKCGKKAAAILGVEPIQIDNQFFSRRFAIQKKKIQRLSKLSAKTIACYFKRRDAIIRSPRQNKQKTLRVSQNIILLFVRIYLQFPEAKRELYNLQHDSQLNFFKGLCFFILSSYERGFTSQSCVYLSMATSLLADSKLTIRQQKALQSYLFKKLPVVGSFLLCEQMFCLMILVINNTNFKLSKKQDKTQYIDFYAVFFFLEKLVIHLRPSLRIFKMMHTWACFILNLYYQVPFWVKLMEMLNWKSEESAKQLDFEQMFAKFEKFSFNVGTKRSKTHLQFKTVCQGLKDFSNPFDIQYYFRQHMANVCPIHDLGAYFWLKLLSKGESKESRPQELQFALQSPPKEQVQEES